jgi:hypothetical protein
MTVINTAPFSWYKTRYPMKSQSLSQITNQSEIYIYFPQVAMGIQCESRNNFISFIHSFIHLLPSQINLPSAPLLRPAPPPLFHAAFLAARDIPPVLTLFNLFALS